MTFRCIFALPFVLLLVTTGLAHGADQPLNLSAASSLSIVPLPADLDKLPPPAAGRANTDYTLTEAVSPDSAFPLAASTAETAASTDLPTTELASPPALPGTIDLITAPDDLFERIRNGFAMPNLTGDLVLTQQQWYINRPDYLRRMVDRSSRYLHHIVEELEKRGMPTELAFLPMVESAYNPMAYSRAHASGLWQFIPSTGKNYNLKQDWWIDERRDVVAATSAALDYLQTIYEMHGDWFLALASYNWGEGAVARAIRKNEAKGLPTDYQSLTMPAETRNYVPKLQALKNIFSNRKLVAQLDLPVVANRAYFATVTPSTNIDVKVAAKLAEMPVQEFVALNPAHNRPVIKSDTPLVIPAEKLETFHANMESHQEEDKPLSKWQTYTLQAGEKLEKVAPRFGITLADLKRINGITPRLKPQAGLTLLVPANEGVGAPDMTALPEQPRFPTADPAPTNRTLVVKKGESLTAFALRGGTTVAELRKINRLKSDRVAAGTRLALVSKPQPATGKAAAPAKGAAPSSKSATKPAKAPRVTRYTVKRGDTLYSIARQFKVEQKDLQRWNGGAAGVLRPGEQLIIQLAQND